MLRIVTFWIFLIYSPHLLADSGEDPHKQKPPDTIKVYQKMVTELMENSRKNPMITYSQSGVECHILISKPDPGIDYKILQAVPDKSIDYKCIKSDLMIRKRLIVPDLNKFHSR